MTQKEDILITYSLTLNQKEDIALNIAAKNAGHRTKSQFIRSMILEYIDNKSLNEALNKALQEVMKDAV